MDAILHPQEFKKGRVNVARITVGVSARGSIFLFKFRAVVPTILLGMVRILREAAGRPALQPQAVRIDAFVASMGFRTDLFGRVEHGGREKHHGLGPAIEIRIIRKEFSEQGQAHQDRHPGDDRGAVLTHLTTQHDGIATLDGYLGIDGPRTVDDRTRQVVGVALGIGVRLTDGLRDLHHDKLLVVDVWCHRELETDVLLRIVLVVIGDAPRVPTRGAFEYVNLLG